MIALDTNILVYSHRTEMAWHARASACIRDLAQSGRDWMIPWPCVHEFLAVVTSPRIFSVPTPAEKAAAQVEAWAEAPGLRFAGESARHWATLKDLLLRGRVAGAAVHDARVAAICKDSAVEMLWTADRDFSRFAGLTAVNPLLDG